MAMISSSPAPDFASSRLFGLHHPHAASSPTEAYRHAELSPSLDASFASSMSITSDPISEPSPVAPAPSRNAFAVSPVSSDAMDISPAKPVSSDAMDISPAKPVVALARPQLAAAKTVSSRQVPGLRAGPPPPLELRSSAAGPSTSAARSLTASTSSTSSSSSSSNAAQFPFLTSLLRSQPPSAAAAVPSPILVDADRSTSPETFLTLPSQTAPLSLNSRPTLQHYATAPSVKASGSRGQIPQFEIEHHDASETEEELSPKPSTRVRAKIPSQWQQTTRHTAPAGSLLQPPPLPPVKRRSEPTVPTIHDGSSPCRMDVDDSSPGVFLSSRPKDHPRSISDSRVGRKASPPSSGGSDASRTSDRIGEFFSSDLSPIMSRKRFLDLENSPTPSNSSPKTVSGLVLGSIVPRRTFEKASSTNCIPQAARRRGSSNNLGGQNRRPSIASIHSMGPPISSHPPVDHKRHAQAVNGRPATLKSSNRRAYSVADASLQGSAILPTESSYRTSMVESLGHRAGAGVSASIDIGKAGAGSLKPRGPPPPESGSPLTGFRTQEEKGKALPCFGVTTDGLMRIDAQTLFQLRRGAFDHEVTKVTIIDCRFKYEYEGGHIDGAINLSEPDKVDSLLQAEDLPEPSTSETAPKGGKHVLVFHCEFSAKRAPTSAGLLRSRDRTLNLAHYPNVHYPEVYILQGGYAEFYKKYPNDCIGGYLEMDDPKHSAKCAVNLQGFRQQTRTFSRAASFTFGEGQAAAARLKETSSNRPPVLRKKTDGQKIAPMNFVFPAKASSGMSITEEEHCSDADTSFGTNPGSSPGGGDSPCPVSKVGRHSLKIGKEVTRRPLARGSQSAANFRC